MMVSQENFCVRFASFRVVLIHFGTKRDKVRSLSNCR